LAYNRATFFSPKQLRELYIPELKQAVRDLHALGLTVFFHSDGNLNAILEDLATCELDGIQGLEPAAGMQIGAVRARLGNALALWGNLGFEFLSAPRTDEEITTALQGLEVENGGRNRLIVGSCGGLVPGLNLETVRRVYR
jgi:uroporphyrinogen decarboxylase